MKGFLVFGSMVALVAIAALLSSALRTEESMTSAEIVKGIEEIPEKYNDHPRVLLEDFQKGLVTQSEVLQILILYHDRGVYSPSGELDVGLELFHVDKKRHVEIEEMRRMLQLK